MGFHRRMKACKTSGGLGLQLVHCPLLCILLAKVSHWFSFDLKDKIKHPASWCKLLQHHIAKGVIQKTIHWGHSCKEFIKAARLLVQLPVWSTQNAVMGKQAPWVMGGSGSGFVHSGFGHVCQNVRHAPTLKSLIEKITSKPRNLKTD